MAFPASVPVHGAGTLSVTLNGSTANVIRVQGLYRETNSGQLTPFSRNVTAPSDRVPVTTNIATDVEGDIVACTVEALTAGTKRGQVYAIVQVAVYSVTTVLCAGYVYDGFLLSLGKFIEPGPGGGEGNIRTVTGTNPAAGAESTETVPTNALWKLLSYSIVLVATGAANRVFTLIVDDGAVANRRALLARNGTNQTDGQTRTHHVQLGDVTIGTAASVNITDTQSVFFLPQMKAQDPYPEGYRLRTLTDSIQAGDDYAAPIFQVEEWLVI